VSLLVQFLNIHWLVTKVLCLWLQFGKGVYFADLVSKSAQYCFTSKSNPVGLMLLSEVALGNVYELKAAKVAFCFIFCYRLSSLEARKFL
jgi:hypothetical protein